MARLNVGDVVTQGGSLPAVVVEIKDMGTFFGRLVLVRDVAGRVVYGKEASFEKLEQPAPTTDTQPRNGGPMSSVSLSRSTLTVKLPADHPDLTDAQFEALNDALEDALDAAKTMLEERLKVAGIQDARIECDI